jgi:branched-chain amino acid transport system permease protein
MMSPTVRYRLFGIWFLILASTPFWAENYIVHLAINIAMYTTLALSWNFIGGFAGYPSFATAAFFGIGCYAGALSNIAGLPSALAWLFASAVVAAFAGLFGAIILRLRGHYFAVASFGLVEVVRLILSSWDRLTGGGDGLNVPLVSGGPDFVARIFLATMLTIMLLVVAVTALVDRGKLGFGLRCIKQNEDAADMVGINVTLYKVVAFVLSATFCGTTGAVYASWVGYIDPVDSFSILMTIKVPVMCLLGGAGTVFGPIVGAGAFLLLDQVIWSNFLDYNLGILGGVIVIIIFFLPGGLLGIRLRGFVAREVRHINRTEVVDINRTEVVDNSQSEVVNINRTEVVR